jgi:hypothetical protein
VAKSGHAGGRMRVRCKESDAEVVWRAGGQSAGDRFGAGDGESPEFPFLCRLSEVKLIRPLLCIAPSCPQG